MPEPQTREEDELITQLQRDPCDEAEAAYAERYGEKVESMGLFIIITNGQPADTV